MTHEYARGTYLMSNEFGFYEARAMCSDGVVRKMRTIAPDADTFFSITASVNVKSRTVAGYVTVESEEGHSTDTEADPKIVKFIAVIYRKNHVLLPQGAWKRTENTDDR